MKKILALALALGATALLACPMQGGQGGMNNGPMGGGMMQKGQCDTSKLPKQFEALGLSDAQKADIQKIRDEGKEFHNQQHEKMMAVLTPDQLKKFEANAPKMCPKGTMKMPMSDKMGQHKMPAGGM